MTQENKAKMRVILNMVDTVWVELDEIRYQEAKAFMKLSSREKQSEIGKEMKKELDHLLGIYDDLSKVLDKLFEHCFTTLEKR